MSTRTVHTPLQSTDLISERAARRGTERRRARILRRWSVAELIARAAARPPVVA